MSLHAWYKFENNFNDSSGNGHNGSGTADFVTGHAGDYAADSDGTEHVDVGDFGSWGSSMGPNPWSICFWWWSSDASPPIITDARIMGVKNQDNLDLFIIHTGRGAQGNGE